MGRRKKTKKIGLVGGLGPRYGLRSRKRYNEIVTEMRQKHPCPQCSSKKVHREYVGVWVCGKCGFKFTGGAYVPQTKLGLTSVRIARRS